MCSIYLGGLLLLRVGNVAGVLPWASRQSRVAWPACFSSFCNPDSVCFCGVPGYFRCLKPESLVVSRSVKLAERPPGSLILGAFKHKVRLVLLHLGLY